LGFVRASPVPSNATEGALEKRATYHGKATYFTPGLGACGYHDGSNDMILAISGAIYGKGGNCNKLITITNTANGKTAVAKTRDMCPTCPSGNLDLSPAVFKKLGTLDKGVLPISWHFQASA